MTTRSAGSRRLVAACLALAGSVACVHRPTASDEHAGHAMPSATVVGSGSMPAPVGDRSAAPSATDASARLAASPRHGEWVMVATGPSPADSLRAWVVYPERSTRAPVVLVVHEIFGLTTWVRAVADQLAAEGFIAIAPDLLTGKHLSGSPDAMPDSAVAAVRQLDLAQVQRQLDAIAAYGMSLPSALPRYGIVGFCWGGGISFAHAVHAPALGASVVFYGVSPKEGFSNVMAPVLGLYGGNDARVGATVAPADSAMRVAGKVYEHVSYEGAGHGFLRQQDGASGANQVAARAAWPRTVAWFHKYLGD